MPGHTLRVESTFGETWGVVVALHLVAAVVNGCVTVQACTYFHKFFHRDRFILKGMVAYIWLGCMTLAVCEFWIIHGVIITGYHLPPEQVVISLGFPIALVVAVTTIGTTQGIYVLRVYRFGHNRYLLACCCTLVGVELGTGFAWARQVARTAPVWQEVMQESGWIITTSVVSSVVLDIFIAVSMCYQLWRSRMMGLKRTRHLVDRLMRWTFVCHCHPHPLVEFNLTNERDFKRRIVAMILMENLNKKNNFYLVLGIGFLPPNCYAVGLLAL
ncbi:hypothetical protein BD779DRAFT_1674979 [Infundibulicybe gibba]|nr:hypothetical protein BD779DRAFT_1674979 [Infundibulicybe gibba]